jgi:putative ABC transport system substrate-binding protein
MKGVMETLATVAYKELKKNGAFLLPHPPATYVTSTFTRDGGLLSYGADNSEQWIAAAGYVDRILRGAKAGDLPVQQPTKFVLTINLKTAKELGLELPLFLQQRADEIFE